MANNVLLVVLGVLAVRIDVSSSTTMPLPFTRELKITTPLMKGSDVFKATAFLMRSRNGSKLSCDLVNPENCAYDMAMANAVGAFQSQQGVMPTGAFDSQTAMLALQILSFDNYVEDTVSPASMGYKYKISISCYRNRSIEDKNAKLISADGKVIHTFTVRVHGAQMLPSPPWPNFNESGTGLNQFTSCGGTPTGLFEIDLNSPEDEPAEFGPWPVNRLTKGLAGNAKFLVGGGVNNTLRDGLLVHTGQWANHSTWREPLPMPNSLGCVHGYPEDIHTVSQLLIADGVTEHKNTNGALPYPFKAQGLLSLQLIDSPQTQFAHTAVVPWLYTMYKQCDDRWAQNVINHKTICDVGCLMSSVSMALNNNDIIIPGDVDVSAVTPATLNTWLKNNNGYDGQDDLNEDSVDALDPSHIFWTANSSHRTADLTMDDVKALLKQRQPVIANVLAGNHFVLVVGWDSNDDDVLYVNDPGFATQTYSFASVVGWRLYKILPETSPYM